jgi:hypothetical protein
VMPPSSATSCYVTPAPIRSAPHHLIRDGVISKDKGAVVMAISIYFRDMGFTPGMYDEAIKQLDAAGVGAPEGRSFHVALESEGEIQVFDIWESQETFDAFGTTLIPILTGLGVQVKPPMVATVHNVIHG